MEPESSLQYSQVPNNCPYPEPTPSSPHNLLSLPEDPSYYYPPIYVLVSPMVSFPQISPPEPFAHLSFKSHYLAENNDELLNATFFIIINTITNICTTNC